MEIADVRSCRHGRPGAREQASGSLAGMKSWFAESLSRSCWRVLQVVNNAPTKAHLRRWYRRLPLPKSPRKTIRCHGHLSQGANGRGAARVSSLLHRRRRASRLSTNGIRRRSRPTDSTPTRSAPVSRSATLTATDFRKCFSRAQRKAGSCIATWSGFRFEDVTAKAGLAAALDNLWATGCTFVDIDGDDDLDLYVCGYNSRNRLFINEGGMQFTERAARYGLDVLGASVMMAFADYDADGDLDAYMLTNHLKPKTTDTFQVALHGGQPTIPEEFRQYRDILIPPAGHGAPKLIEAAQRDILFRNDGNGAFTDVTEAAGIGKHNHHGLSATWWDCEFRRARGPVRGERLFRPRSSLREQRGRHVHRPC